MNRRKRVDRTGSAPKRRSATVFSAEEVAEWHGDEASASSESAQPRPTCTFDFATCTCRHCVRERVPEHHNDRLSRLVGEVADRLRAEGLAPADAVYVAEGAADRIRREAEEAKRAARGGAR